MILGSTSHLFLFYKKRESQTWWFMPVIPVTQEAEARGLLEPRSLRPTWTTQQNAVS
jgi:hypothetical protein